MTRVGGGGGFFVRPAVGAPGAATAHEWACDARSGAVCAVHADKCGVAVGRGDGGQIAGSAREELFAAAARP